MEFTDRAVIVECPFRRHGPPDVEFSVEVDNAAAAAAGEPKGTELINEAGADMPPADKSPAAAAADLAVRNAVRKTIEDTTEPDHGEDKVAPPAESKADTKDTPIPSENGDEGGQDNPPEAAPGNEDQPGMSKEHQSAGGTVINEASNHTEDERDTSPAEEADSGPARIEKPALDKSRPDIDEDDSPAETPVSDTVDETKGSESKGDEEVVDKDRREYLRMGGFILVNDVGHRAMDAASEVPVKSLSRYANWQAPETAVSSVVALGLVTTDLASRAIPLIAPPETLKRKYEVTDADLSDNHFVGEDGVSDLDFTWRFGPGIAKEIIESAVGQGYITTEQEADLSMGDWSDMIGSDWYRGIMHDMALTKPGVYTSFGRGIQWYTFPGGFRETLDAAGFALDNDEPLFTFESQYDEETDETRLTASVTPSLRKELRREMKAAKSPGCPVARHHGTIDEGLTHDNAHLQKQVDDGILILSEAKNGKVGFTQERTPIDSGLEILAAHLDAYDRQFGTPQWTNEERTLEHRQRARTDALRRPGDVPFIRAA